MKALKELFFYFCNICISILIFDCSRLNVHRMVGFVVNSAIDFIAPINITEAVRNSTLAK